MFPRPIPRPLPLAATWAFRIAAFPRPAPEPWFLFFMLFNMGAFFSMSGRIRKRILLPRIYTCSSCATRPSLYVTVMLDIWQFMLSSASMSFPRYTSPVFVSQVTMCPSASCRTLIGTPIDISAGREFYREREREREIRVHGSGPERHVAQASLKAGHSVTLSKNAKGVFFFLTLFFLLFRAAPPAYGS